MEPFPPVPEQLKSALIEATEWALKEDALEVRDVQVRAARFQHYNVSGAEAVSCMSDAGPLGSVKLCNCGRYRMHRVEGWV